MDNFRVIEEIGKGKFSTVYKARKRKTIQYAAVKQVDKFHKAKVENEVKILNMLDHPNVLKFYNWYETTNSFWIIIEYCSGGDLMNLLQQDQSLPEETVHLFGLDLVNGLQVVHSKGIIYCDLKPSNVLIDGCGVLKLSDFGLAQQVKDQVIDNPTKNDSNLSAGPPKRGSPCYMAPELFQGGSHSVYSDLWSLGCVLYELASGSPPFVGQTFESLVDAILNQEVQSLPNFSAEFNDLIRCLLQKKPSDRITWDRLREHPFWKESLRVPTQDEQKFLTPKLSQSNGIVLESISQVDTAQNVLRLSKIVKSNIEKERGYQESSNQQIDQRVLNDAEYNFDETEAEEEKQENDDDDDEDYEGHESEAEPVRPSPLPLNRRQSVVENDIQDDRSESLAYPTMNIVVDQNVKIMSVTSSDLLFNDSDTFVRPIISNSRIEKVPEPKYDAEKLAFTPYTLKEVMNIPHSEVEKHLTIVYKSIGGTTPVATKLEALCYFETLCGDEQSAALFINSSLMRLFIKMLRTHKSPSLKCRLCSVMGLLMRHANYISSELSQAGIFDVFLEILNDTNVKVKRRAIACLGELMFYIASQENAPPPVDEKQKTDWVIPNGVVPAIINALKSSDEIIQHYSTKTIENITAVSKQYAKKFTVPETITNMVKIFTKTQNDYLKGSAISSLSRICKHKNHLSLQIIETLTPKFIVGLLKDNNVRAQQSALNIINLALIADATSKHVQKIVEHPGFAESILELNEGSSATLRGKSMMTFHLLSKANPSFVLQCCEARLCVMLERLANKEKDSYVRKCMAVLIDSVAKIVIPVLEGAAVSIEKKQSLGHKSLTVVLHLMTSPCFSPKVVSYEFITLISKCLQLVEPSSTSDDLTKTLLLIVEALSQQQTILTQHKVIVDKLLSSVVHMLKNDSGDIRFLCLKILTDILVRYLNDTNIYNLEQPSSENSTLSMNEFITKLLLPRYKQILDDQDPIPLYGLKLLNNIAEHNPGFISVIHRLDIVPKLFEFFELEHRNNNVHNVRLILKIIGADVLEDEDMYNLGVVTKLNAVLSYAFTNGVETFFEPCLGIVDHLLYRASRIFLKCQTQSDKALREKANYIRKNNEPLVDNIGVYLELCCHTDFSIAEASAHVLLLLSQQYSTCHDVLFSLKGMKILRKALVEYSKISQLAFPDANEPERSAQGEHSVANYILKLLSSYQKASQVDHISVQTITNWISALEVGN